jgi:DNA end-binding protein Ku
MIMRSIASEISISYGLHNIPVKVCTVIETPGTGMSNCCPECHGSVGHKNYCKDCLKEPDSKDILKAYKVGKEKHVFTEVELASLQKTEKEIDVVGVRNIDSIDPRYITGSYYLVPTVARKAYAILLEGMERAGKAIVVKYTIRNVQKMGILVPQTIDGQGIILLRTMAFSAQIKPIDEEVKYDLTMAESDMGVDFMNSLKDVNLESFENERKKTIEKILDGEMETISVSVKASKDETAFFK